MSEEIVNETTIVTDLLKSLLARKPAYIYYTYIITGLIKRQTFLVNYRDGLV